MLRIHFVFSLVLGGATLVSLPVLARPIPQIERAASGELRLRHGTARPHHALVPQPKMQTLSAPPYAETRVVETDVDVTLDPVTGATTGKLVMTIEATSGTVDTLYLYFDEGMSITTAEAGTTTVGVYDQVSPPLSYNMLTFTPPIPAGQTVTLTVDYGGTLKCGGTSGFGNSFCTLEEPMGLLMEGSALPLIVDQGGLGGYNVWGAKRALTFRLPSGTNVVASGDKVTDDDDGTTHVTRWETPGYHTAGPHMALLASPFSTLAVPGTAPLTSVHALPSASTSQANMASWMPKILSFLDQQAGAPLPFPALDIVHLPPDWVLPGTASHGLVLLSENYGQSSLAYFEETLAHETAHEWWGILINPTDGMHTRWLTEGLATLSQVDYAAQHLRGSASLDVYLERRFNEHSQIVRYLAQDLPPLVSPTEDPPDDDVQSTIWAYLRSSATLDHLRVLVGPDAFATALKNWVAQCAMQHCDTTDFRNILEDASGLDLESVFQHWVYDSPYPAPVLDFQSTDSNVTIATSGIEHEIPLRVILGYADGTEETRLVTLSPGAPLALATDRRVRSVRPHPRHDAVIWSRSAQSGDVTFDREVDGLDVILCAHSSGRSAGPQDIGGEGIWRHDLDFNVRCDPNGDGSVDDGDLAAQLDAFATLTAESQ